jgi:hypothetical protein
MGELVDSLSSGAAKGAAADPASAATGKQKLKTSKAPRVFYLEVGLILQ